MSVKLRLPHPQYDTDIESRANELWKKAVHTINNTTREERRVCYITLNRPEEEHS
ncbi:conjugal transfer protein TrbC, partial [Escherichia coli]|nr:conjugal transfer protein TrbC [Escherichia coli]EJV5534808.1 conjugal transfer protein TrbC [Escherichia coli]